VWKITPPSGNPLTVTAPADWNGTGTACDSGQGKLQRIDLLPTVQSSVKTLGLWTLSVSDQTAGIEGTLIQWRVVVQGLN
jgi:subtilisin-like proprotein convertase family protein